MVIQLGKFTRILYLNWLDYMICQIYISKIIYWKAIVNVIRKIRFCKNKTEEQKAIFLKEHSENKEVLGIENMLAGVKKFMS